MAIQDESCPHATAFSRCFIHWLLSGADRINGKVKRLDNTTVLSCFLLTGGSYCCWMNQHLLYTATTGTWIGIQRIRIKGYFQIDEVAARGQSYPLNPQTRLIDGLQEDQKMRAYFSFPNATHQSPEPRHQFYYHFYYHTIVALHEKEYLTTAVNQKSQEFQLLKSKDLVSIYI